MKAFVTSIGERTTDICVKQLERNGFDVHLLDKKELWIEKYNAFIRYAAGLDEDVLRVDADIIVNRNIREIPMVANVYENAYMIQFQVFDFYKNDITIGGPIIYKKEGLKKMANLLLKVTDINRPETCLSRLPDINPHLETVKLLVGMHGFFQDQETMDRALKNKKQRKQWEKFDFNLVKELTSL